MSVCLLLIVLRCWFIYSFWSLWFWSQSVLIYRGTKVGSLFSCWGKSFVYISFISLNYNTGAMQHVYETYKNSISEKPGIWSAVRESSLHWLEVRIIGLKSFCMKLFIVSCDGKTVSEMICYASSWMLKSFHFSNVCVYVSVRCVAMQQV